MKYSDFEKAISADRMERYLKSCGGDTRKAMKLYRYNLQISQAMFTVISCFEVVLRNKIDQHLIRQLGHEWLRDSVIGNGIFTLPILKKTHSIINSAYWRLNKSRSYTHTKLLAEMEFGIWKYMFSPIQYRQCGQNLLCIFPNKPRSSVSQQYNQTYVFKELDKINAMRNRIAHHEPICFRAQSAEIDSTYIETIYEKIISLFSWMGMDSKALLYGLDRVGVLCGKLKNLK